MADEVHIEVLEFDGTAPPGAHLIPFPRKTDGTPDLAKGMPGVDAILAAQEKGHRWRQHMKRFSRLTAAHSKKIDNHVAMVALYTTFYNYARINSAVRMSPAMAARLTDTLWDIGDIVKLIEDWEAEQ